MSGLTIEDKTTDRSRRESPLTKILFIILVIVLDVGAIWFIQDAMSRGFTQLVIIIGFITVMLNLIFLLSKAYPFRWMALGLSFLILFTIYPMIFTILMAFTNYGDGHLLTKEQAIPLIERQTFLPEEGKSYSWTAFRNEAGDYALWLVNPEGETFIARSGQEIEPAQPGDPGIGEADSNGIPTSLEGYERLNPLFAATNQDLPNIKFGLEGEQAIQIRSPSEAAELQVRFVYDEATDTVVDQSNGEIYYNINGTFTSRTGKTITPGFRTWIGLQNFTDFARPPGSDHDLELHFPYHQRLVHVCSGVDDCHLV